ncbi:MAG: hypothetical protein U0U70_08375 [Chitinophagaceae bacterium]
MKLPALLLALFCCVVVSAQPILIHAHNDYQQPQPLTKALQNQVYSLEADVYLVNDTLKVAHEAKELPAAPALSSLYIQPLVQLFAEHHNRVSAADNYAPVLMIDIKENAAAVIPALVKLLSPYPQVFNRQINPLAVQIVLSGERGPLQTWTTWPAFIQFDGRPEEQYDAPTLERVAFISDAYLRYTRPADSLEVKLYQLALRTHKLGKKLRVWGIPDTEPSWENMHGLGVDIINTDKVAECRKYFGK